MHSVIYNADLVYDLCLLAVILHEEKIIDEEIKTRNKDTLIRT